MKKRVIVIGCSLAIIGLIGGYFFINGKEKASSNNERILLENNENDTNENKKEYVSRNLGFSITFPSSWTNHYRVEESSDGIMVFFKPKEKPLTYKGEGWLFSITKKTGDKDKEYYDSVGPAKTFQVNGVTYLIGGPTDFPLLEDHPELNKFHEMMKERPKVVTTIKVLK
ncbi:hypothetical protein [Clostridium sp.]|uniref:hypothetical protein n=1 Tax=Clostridium sp. TaxID=1506 RepID=UPI003464D2DE